MHGQKTAACLFQEQKSKADARYSLTSACLGLFAYSLNGSCNSPVPKIVVCDNCKQAVIANKDWIEPELNKDYAEWAEHNDTAIVPAGVRKPRHKSSVECAVGIMESSFFHDIEERRYFSLEQFNADLFHFVDEMNKRPFSKDQSETRWDRWNEEKKELLHPHG